MTAEHSTWSTPAAVLNRRSVAPVTPPAPTPVAANPLGILPPTAPAELELCSRLPELLTADRTQPWHEPAALLFAREVSMTEIAATLGVSVESVRQVLQTAQFQQRIKEHMEAAGRVFELGNLFKAEAINCLATLVALRDNPSVSVAQRIKATIELLDRGMGKAISRLEFSDITKTPVGDPIIERRRLAEENERLLKTVGRVATAREITPGSTPPPTGA